MHGLEVCLYLTVNAWHSLLHGTCAGGLEAQWHSWRATDTDTLWLDSFFCCCGLLHRGLLASGSGVAV
jgi:hypothetical protein